MSKQQNLRSFETENQARVPRAGLVPQTGRFLLFPEVAAHWLATYRKEQRPVDDGWVRALVGRQQRGEWIYNGDAIRFSSRRMIDGQHRCEMVVLSKIPADVRVEIGIDDEAFETLDRPKVRSIGQVFSLEGELNAASLVAACCALWNWEEGGNPSQKARGGLSVAQIREVLLRNPGIRESNQVVNGLLARGLGLRNAFTCLVHYKAGGFNPAKRDVFFEQLNTGIGFEKNDPVQLLRDRLIADVNTKHGKLSGSYRLAIMIKAWNAHALGKKIYQLRFGKIRKTEEEFPEFIGFERKKVASRPA